uniref:GDT1 family protein n=1 Tax=Zea mays TaxID=4577 RepID=A0A804M5J1_MAIZE
MASSPLGVTFPPSHFLFFIQGFTKSLAMTVLSKIGDKTFFATAVRLLPPSPSHGLGAFRPGVRRYASMACLFARLLGATVGGKFVRRTIGTGSIPSQHRAVAAEVQIRQWSERVKRLGVEFMVRFTSVSTAAELR